MEVSPMEGSEGTGLMRRQSPISMRSAPKKQP